MSKKKFSTFSLSKNPKRPFWNIVGYDSKGKRLQRSSGTTSKKDAELIGQQLVDSDWKESGGRLTKNVSQVSPKARALIKKLADKGALNKEIAQKVYEKFNIELSNSTISKYTGRPVVEAQPIEQIDKYLKEHGLKLGGTEEEKRARVNNRNYKRRRKAKKPDITYTYQDQLKDFRKRGLSIDSPEVQQFLDRRTRNAVDSIKSKSKVYSYETVDGLPDGEKKPDSKKLVANLFEDSDAKEIRALARDVVEKQARMFFETGKIPDVDHLDHIFPSGSPRIINGQLVGGAELDGVFQGVGVGKRQNLQALPGGLNSSQQNILHPEKIAALPLENPVGSISVEESLAKPPTRKDTLARIRQWGDSQQGKTDASGKPIKKPRGIFNGTALSLLAGLPLWFLSDDSYAKMVDKGEETISSTADKILPQGLIDYAKNIGSKADNAISKTFDMFGANNTASLTPNPMAAMQWLYEGGKQIPGEIAGLLNFVGTNPEEYLNPEKNSSWLEEKRRLQSGRSY